MATQSDTRTGGPAGIPWARLASDIMNRHMTDDDVLDNRELQKLRDFVAEDNVSLRRSAEARGDRSHTTANGYPVVSDEPAPGSAGSLVDYIIRKHGTDEQKMYDSEIDSLTQWFRAGGGEPNPRY